MSSVLVVDDDPISIHLLKIMLERGGYSVISARGGKAALEMIAAERPGIILVDDMMPLMTGGELCRAIKDNPTTWDIPVILMSAGTRVESASYIAQAGADYALTKPIISSDVFDAIERVMARKKT
ncbi:MAG: response regulator [Chloroflexota bacterium]